MKKQEILDLIDERVEEALVNERKRLIEKAKTMENGYYESYSDFTQKLFEVVYVPSHDKLIETEVNRVLNLFEQNGTVNNAFGEANGYSPNGDVFGSSVYTRGYMLLNGDTTSVRMMALDFKISKSEVIKHLKKMNIKDNDIIYHSTSGIDSIEKVTLKHLIDHIKERCDDEIVDGAYRETFE